MTTDLSVSILAIGIFFAGAAALMAGALLISLVLDRLGAASGGAGMLSGIGSMLLVGGLAGYLQRSVDFAFLGAICGLALAYAGAMLIRKCSSKGQTP